MKWSADVGSLFSDFPIFSISYFSLVWWGVSYFPHDVNDVRFLSKSKGLDGWQWKQTSHFINMFRHVCHTILQNKIVAQTEKGGLVSSQVPAYLTIFNVVRNQYFFLGEEILSAMPMAAIKLVSALLLIEMAEPGSEGHRSIGTAHGVS